MFTITLFQIFFFIFITQFSLLFSSTWALVWCLWFRSCCYMVISQLKALKYEHQPLSTLLNNSLSQPQNVSADRHLLVVSDSGSTHRLQDRNYKVTSSVIVNQKVWSLLALRASLERESLLLLTIQTVTGPFLKKKKKSFIKY